MDVLVLLEVLVLIPLIFMGVLVLTFMEVLILVLLFLEVLVVILLQVQSIALFVVRFLLRMPRATLGTVLELLEVALVLLEVLDHHSKMVPKWTRTW